MNASKVFDWIILSLFQSLTKFLQIPYAIQGINPFGAAISLFKKEIMTDSNSDIISSIKKFLGEKYTCT